VTEEKQSSSEEKHVLAWDARWWWLGRLVCECWRGTTEGLHYISECGFTIGELMYEGTAYGRIFCSAVTSYMV